MNDLDLMNAFGATFWVIMALATVVLIAGGYWLGGVIARKTDTGFGGFMVILLVTVMVASSFIPLAIFGAIGDFMAVLNPMAPIDEALLMGQGMDGVARIFMAAIVATGSVVCCFAASVIGLARGRN